jgi:hypothetical protein
MRTAIARCSTFAAVICALSALVAVAPAQATPAWQASANLAEAGQNAETPQVAVDAQGDTVAVWRRYDGSNQIVQGAVRPAGGSWQTPVSLSEAGRNAEAPQVAVDAQGDAVAVWQRYDGSHPIVQGAIMPAGGSWQTPVSLSEAGQNAEKPQVAVDAHGDAVAVWQRYDGSHPIVQGAIMPAGRSWQTPVSLSEAGQNAEKPQVAVDAHGDAVAVWQRYDGSNLIVQGAALPAGGSWQAPVNLSEAGHFAEAPQVALDPQGDAVAVWQRSNGSNRIVQGAFRPAGGSWGVPVNLSEAGQSAEAPQVVIDALGDAVAVWERYDGSHEIVQGAIMPAAGSWQTPVNLSEAGRSAETPQVSFDPQGDAVAVWPRYNGSNLIVQGAVRPAGGSWQAPVNLSEAGQFAETPQVAIGAHGDAVAVWERYDGSHPMVQGAGYDAAGPLLDGLSIPTAGTAGRAVSFSVSPLDAWSALGASTWTFGDGAGAAAMSVAHTYTAAGSYQVTLQSADVLGNTTSATATIAIVPASVPSTPVLSSTPSVLSTVAVPSTAIASAPVTTGLKQSHRAWREGKALAKAPKGKRRLPIGTTFTFSLNEDASVKLAFTRAASGRKVGNACVAQIKQNRKRHRCTRTVPVGALTFSAHAGPNEVHFAGRISKGLELEPGSYTLVVVATAPGEHSTPRTLRFTIAKV